MGFGGDHCRIWCKNTCTAGWTFIFFRRCLVFIWSDTQWMRGLVLVAWRWCLCIDTLVFTLWCFYTLVSVHRHKCLAVGINYIFICVLLWMNSTGQWLGVNTRFLQCVMGYLFHYSCNVFGFFFFLVFFCVFVFFCFLYHLCNIFVEH